jgi:two-component system sensor histidine kinase RegB
MMCAMARLEFHPPGRVRLRTLTLIRWIGVVGQAVAILVVHYGLGFRLPLGACLAVVGASALINLGVTVIMLDRPASMRLGQREALGFLAYDIVQLALLLYLTGGLQNPFAVLLLAPVTVSATILVPVPTIALCALSMVAITLLTVLHEPLPWSGGGLELHPVYVLGIWTALGLAIVFCAIYAFRVAAEARRMSNALAATQLTLSRERQLSALGALAAAAAHELGSPLGTILVAAREIAADLPEDSPIRGDVDVVVSEALRCREILARLATRAEGDEPFARLPISAVVELAAQPHAREGVELAFDSRPLDGEGAAAQPVIARSAEIQHGLGNLIQNAIQVARGEVRVATRWSDRAVEVRISDDGPGFPAGMLERLGEPYVSGWRDGADHMGLGIFIAGALLGRTGGNVSFANREGGGAEVAVRWNRAILEAGEQPDAV